MTRRKPDPVVKRIPHNPNAHVIENKAIYSWADKRRAA